MPEHIFQYANDAMFVIDLKGVIIQCNDAVEKLYGYRTNELTGEQFSILLSPGKINEFETNKENLLFGENSEAFETIRVARNKNVVKVSASYSPVKDESGKITGIYLIDRKITHYRSIASKAQALLETAPDSMVIVNSSGQIVLVNAQTELLFGYTKEELLGEDVEILIPKRFLGKHGENRRNFFAAPRARNMGVGLELFGIKKDGTEFPVEISLSPMTTEEGVFVSAAIRNTSERKKAEKKFRGLLESAPDAIIIVNREGIIQLTNAQTEYLFEYKKEEMLGQRVEMLIPARFMDSHPHHREAFFANPKTRGMGVGLELFGKKKNGKEFPVEISLSPLETEEGTLVSAAVRDISEKKRLEHEIRDANINLEKKVRQRTAELETKNRELEQFAYVASHDLQEPLRTTSSFVDLFKKKYIGKLDEEADTMLNYIVQSSDRMKVLIKDLLDYSRIGRKTDIQPVDCNIILKEVLADLNKNIQETKTEIKTGKLPLINGYPTELKLIFQNLITNAIKFRKKDIAPIINIFAEKKGGYWQFSVEDNGIGIEEKHKDRIFVIFQRLHNRTEYDGSGIGLAHCKKIAELHGGKIWVESKPGEGSTFHFTIYEM